MGKSQAIGPLVFRAPVTSQGEISSGIQKLQTDLKKFKQDTEDFANGLPPDARDAFHRVMDLEIEKFENELKELIALNSGYSNVGYRIDDLTTRFNGLCKTLDAGRQNYAINRQLVEKSDQAFSATLQQTKFSFPSSFGSRNSLAGQPIAPPRSPDKGKLVEAQIHWKYYAEKLPEGTQEPFLKRVDNAMTNLEKRREFLAKSGVTPERSAELLAKDIERIDFDLKLGNPLPSEKE